jgi:hypothetical protein
MADGKNGFFIYNTLNRRHFKGQCHETFNLRFFFSTSALYPMAPVSYPFLV